MAWQKLAELNNKLVVSNKPQIKLLPADGNLEWDDFIEMADVGLVQYTVTPSHIAQLWKNVFTDLRIYEEFSVVDRMDSGWAVRKDSPKLRMLLDYIRDDYFKDDAMDPLNKTLITLAAYNAGPARLKQCRQMAAEMGLNPNIWFRNVEYAVAKKVGAETVGYVSNIHKYYIGWKLMSEREAGRARSKLVLSTSGRTN